jgi:hypothetical protein
MPESALKTTPPMPAPEPKSEASTSKREVRVCGPTETDPFDDVHDNQSDWDRYASLLPLSWCCMISDTFDKADKRALWFQRRHRRVVYTAALSASFAVVFAIAGLAYAAANGVKPGAKFEDAKKETVEKRIEWVEIATALLTFAAVALGRHRRYKVTWLRLRHRAELYRLLRYEFLIQPSLWSGSESPENWIRKRIRDIEHLTGEDALDKALNEPSPAGPYEPSDSRMTRESLQALTEYYLGKRLGPQKEYLANRAQRNEIKDHMRHYLPLFFFSSSLAVGAKLVSNLLRFHRLAFWFVLAAILLPVLAAGIRTYLAAFEFSRNKSRFYAAHKALSDTEKSLVQNTFAAVTAEPYGQRRPESVLIGPNFGQVIVVADNDAVDANSAKADANAYPVLRDLAWCEHLLNAEHREWLRLMYDAEWFG